MNPDFIPWPVVASRLDIIRQRDPVRWWSIRLLLDRRIKAGQVRVIGKGMETMLSLDDLRRCSW